MNTMTPRQRILAAARHKPVDGIPMMLWIEPHTLLKISQSVVRPRKTADRILLDGIAAVQDLAPTDELRNAAPFLSMLASPDYLAQLGTDMIEFPWSDPLSFVKDVRFDSGKLRVTDIYGAEHGMMGLYMEITKVPCATPEELDRYRFPRISNHLLRQSIRAFRRAHPGIAVDAAVPGVQDVSQWFMGLENLYLWMAMYPDIVNRFFNRMLEHTLGVIRGLLRAGADIITILDDYGAQGRLLISKKMWNEFSYPCLNRQCEEVHRHGGIVMLHSCGFVQPLLDRIVDAGVDMLQSFQPGAGNNLQQAKAEFGDRLCFVTGIDSQQLPGMSPAQVRDSVLENLRIGSEGGGFVLATNHALQVDTPAENLHALFDTLRSIRKRTNGS